MLSTVKKKTAGWTEYPPTGLPMEPRETHLGAAGALGPKKGPGPQYHPVLEPPLQLGQLAEQSLGVGIYGLEGTRVGRRPAAGEWAAGISGKHADLGESGGKLE